MDPYGPVFGATDLFYGSTLTRGVADPDLVAFIAAEPFALGSAKLFLSTDDGANWIDAGPVSQFGVPKIVEESAGPYLVRLSDDSSGAGVVVFLRRSPGWNALDQTLFLALDFEVSFTFAERHPTTMWRTVSDPVGPPGGLERSDDGGTSWQPTGAGGAGGWLTAHPLRPGMVLRRTTTSIETSTDFGDTWQTALPADPVRRFTLSGDGRYVVSWAFHSPVIQRAEISPYIGAPECSASVNSSGQPARIRAMGSLSVGTNALTLIADRVATSQFGMFVVGRQPGFIPGAGGSFGNLCLSGSIGRYNNLLQDSGPHGELYGNIDLTQIPAPSQFVAALAGETWRFQAWFRDVQMGQQGSNFSNALALTFVP